MKKNIPICLLSLIILSSCNNNLADSQEKMTKEALLESARLGFVVDGNLTMQKTYYLDGGYLLPSGETTTEEYAMTLTYQNNNNYIGLDRRYYEIVDGERDCFLSENLWNNKGYVGINYLDYTNTVRNDGYSMNDGFNYDTYSGNGFANPFLQINHKDLEKKDEKTYILSDEKANLIFGYWFSAIDNIAMSVTTNEMLLFVENDLFAGGRWTTNLYKTVETNLSTFENEYVTHSYQFEFTLTNVGVANSKNLISSEPNKPENDDLQTAIDNFMKADTLTIDRHLEAYINGEKQPAEQCITMYYADKDIYCQVWDYVASNGVVPNYPTASDMYLIPNSNGYMDVYSLSEDDKFVHDTINYSSIDGVYDYLSYLPGIFSWDYISKNVFNLNEDGSYSPILDNLPYTAAELFIPFVSSISYVEYGFTSATRIYLTDDKTNIDRIEVEYDYLYYTGLMTYKILNFDSTKIPFEITLA